MSLDDLVGVDMTSFYCHNPEDGDEGNGVSLLFKILVFIKNRLISVLHFRSNLFDAKVIYYIVNFRPVLLEIIWLVVDASLCTVWICTEMDVKMLRESARYYDPLTVVVVSEKCIWAAWTLAEHDGIVPWICCSGLPGFHQLYNPYRSRYFPLSLSISTVQTSQINNKKKTSVTRPSDQKSIIYYLQEVGRFRSCLSARGSSEVRRDAPLGFSLKVTRSPSVLRTPCGGTRGLAMLACSCSLLPVREDFLPLFTHYTFVLWQNSALMCWLSSSGLWLMFLAVLITDSNSKE